MAVLSNPTVVGQGGGQGEPRWVMLAFPKVTAGDTFDASTLSGTTAAFQTIFAATFYATSNRTETFAASTEVGTVITIVGTGIAADSGLLFIAGE